MVCPIFGKWFKKMQEDRERLSEKDIGTGTERRLYERIPLFIRFKYEVKARPHLIKKSVSKNISGSGLCLSLQEKLLPRTELKMEVEITSNSDIVHLNGRVTWTRRVEVEDDVTTMVYYDTGVELIDADPINLNRIITHCYTKSF